MKRSISIAIAWLSAGAAVAAGGPAAPVPDLRVGDAWTLRASDGYSGRPERMLRYTVSSVSGDRVVLAGTGPQSAQELTASLNPRSGQLPDGRTVTYATPLPEFEFPLHPGKCWSGETVATPDISGAKLRVRVIARVAGWEKVSTPAGQFDALRVVRDLYVEHDEPSRRGPRVTQVDWYAPAAKTVVRREERVEIFDISARPYGWRKGERTTAELTALELAPLR